MSRTRFIFSGSGGQGVITAAVILGETAVMYEGLNAVQSQSYGPEARGGAARSEVIISDETINFPKVNSANVLVCLTQQAYNKYSMAIRPGGLIITESHNIKLLKKVDARQIGLPFSETASEKVGMPVTMNICMLGAVVGLTEIVNRDAVLKTIATRVPPDFLAANKKAFQLGLDLVEPYI